MRKKSLFYLASFFIPLTILSISLATQNIWWRSDTTILASDGFHQYVIFANTLRDILHGKDSLFYSFTSGLGLNFYALISYYLGSLLSPLVYFFDLESMPDAIYLMTVIKIGLTGLTNFTSLSTIYKKVNSWLILSLSTSLALMSFSMGQIEITMWLDVFILVPLILLGLHQLLTKRSYFLYFTSLSTLFLLNYYFGFMTAIFVTLWFLTQLSWDFKNRWKKLGDFIIVSLLAGLTSSVMLLPTYLDLKTHGEKLTDLSKWLTDQSWYLDPFAKNMLGAYDTTKFGSIPTIYVGLFPLILALAFFTVKSIKWPVKLAYGALLSFIVASFYLEPLDLFWQGMHAPNMFLHRYSWVFSVVITYMAAETLSRHDQLTIKRLLPSLSILTAGFTGVAIFHKHYDFLTLENFSLTLCFLLAYGVILISYHGRQIDRKLYIIFTVFFTLFETSINGFYQLTSLNADWHFPSREGYARNLTDLDKLVKAADATEADFFRFEKWLPQTGNDSMKHGYNGISQFSSVRNRKSSQLLDKMGFRSDGTNLNLRYQNNTLIADSLFAVRYNVHDKPINKYGFDLFNQSGNLLLYRNQHALPLALLTGEPYQEIELTSKTLDNQTKLLNHLAGLELSYFHKQTTTSPQANQEQRITTLKATDGSSYADLSLWVPGHSQAYLSLPSLTSSNEDNKSIKVELNGHLLDYTRDNAFSLLDLGYYEEDTTLNLRLVFPETESVSFNQPNAYALDIQALETALEAIKTRPVTAKTKGNQVQISYQSQEDSSLLVTLPYDKGWTAQQDGQPLPVKAAQEGLILLDAKKGQGEIILTFVPHGFKEGSLLSLAGLLGFLVFLGLKAKKKH